ncbi:hypothetical protein V501_02110 [Pseudogymnoascus sp. VKM F-4519 (FW-2642)]|nr:hypothetical protein V501_02110 [Pseudogymnoascus sp. VKM F-4519 (FW-2642)]
MVGGIHDDIIPDSDDKSIVDADADSNYGLDAIDGELGTVDKTFSVVPVQIPHVEADVTRFWTRVRGILQGLEDFARKIRYDKAQEKPTYPLSFSSGLSSVLYRRNNSW